MKSFIENVFKKLVFLLFLLKSLWNEANFELSDERMARLQLLVSAAHARGLEARQISCKVRNKLSFLMN